MRRFSEGHELTFGEDTGWRLCINSEAEVEELSCSTTRRLVPVGYKIDLELFHNGMPVLLLKDAKLLTVWGQELELLMRKLDELNKQEESSDS